jgi:predicted nucleotidyltransferase/DNA-binding transcriptional ArsR family regulator
LQFVPKKGTIVTIMSTDNITDTLSAALFGKTRLAVLSLLYSHVDEAFYLRQIVRRVSAGLGAVQRELSTLTKAGIVVRMVRGRQVYYQANSQCPIFPELKGLIMKTSGAADVLKSSLGLLADRIDAAFIYGSVARSEENRQSDMDLLVVGEVPFAEVVSALDQAQNILGREINPAVYPRAEFVSKLSAGHHFLKTVMAGPKLFIIGDRRELTRLAKKRVAD